MFAEIAQQHRKMPKVLQRMLISITFLVVSSENGDRR